MMVLEGNHVAGRPSLPGVDELFGSSAMRPRREHDPSQEVSPDAVDPDALDAARRSLADEDDVLRAARLRAGKAGTPPPPEVGALLRWAVRAGGAKQVVEVGSAAGVSGAWLLTALPQGGVLTSIEPDPDLHELAAETYRSLSVRSRPRSIQDEPGTVLPRLADDSYDLLLLQADPSGYLEDLGHARRLLRDGGMLIARGVLRGDGARNALERFVAALGEDDGFAATVLPVDGGLVLATRHRHGG
jgi:predicted O-methyltransferase YrrM